MALKKNSMKIYTVVLLLVAILLTSCNNYEKPIKYNWTDMGTTISMSIQTTLISGRATIITTRGTVISTYQYPNPFIIGVPVYVRDDSEVAKVGNEFIWLDRQ